MNAMVVVDASVWVSWLRLPDVNHNASHLWIEHYITKGGMLVAPTLLAIEVEVAASISRQTGQIVQAKEAVKSLYSLNAMCVISIDLTLVQTAVDIAADLQLRAGDVTYVAVAHQLGISLVSWDKEQLERSSRLITTYTPDTYTF